MEFKRIDQSQPGLRNASWQNAENMGKIRYWITGLKKKVQKSKRQFALLQHILIQVEWGLETIYIHIGHLIHWIALKIKFLTLFLHVIIINLNLNINISMSLPKYV